MTRKEYLQIQTRLDSLERKLERLCGEGKADLPLPAHEYEDLPAGAVVKKDYVAYRFGCSERAVQRGEAGTNVIRRVSSKPIKFIRREVDAAWREKCRPKEEKAAEARADADTPRRRSLFGKKQGRESMGDAPVKV